MPPIAQLAANAGDGDGEWGSENAVGGRPSAPSHRSESVSFSRADERV